MLAALGDAVTAKNAAAVNAKIIIEVANGPVNEAAYKLLSKKGVDILPAIVASSGGVIVSYLEWVQNKKNEKWPEEKVNKELEKYMKKALKAVSDTAEKYGSGLTEAAFILALERLSK